MKEFKGVIPPTLTLFTKSGEVDEDLHREYIEFLIQGGVHGLFACGTFGTGIMMSPGQHKKAVEMTVDQAKGRADVIAHVGTVSTDRSIVLARNAEEVGADAVSSLPPFYYKHTSEAIVAHYAALVKNVSIPVLTYNNPTTTGVFITPDMAVELVRVGVKGMKDTGPIENFYLMKERVKAAGLLDGFQFIIGTGAHWLPAALTGTKAMVTGSANMFPEVVVDMYNTTVSKGVQAAVDLGMKVVRLRDIQLIGGKILTTLAVLEMRGLKAGYPKAPFQPLDASVKQRIRDALIEEGMGSYLKA